MDVSARIADLAATAAQKHGLDVETVKISAAGKNTRVLITIDLPEDQVGSAALDDVAAASRAISEVLDEANLPPGPHTLEVSTPGTDRLLTTEHHFKRARTRRVTVELNDGVKITGRLSSVADGEVLLETEDGPAAIPLSNIATGSIQIEMKRK